MNYELDRRQFATASAALAAGIVLNRNEPCVAKEGSAPNKKALVRLGINALARAHKMNYDLIARANAPELAKEFDAKAWHLF